MSPRGTPDGQAVTYETASQITDLGAHANYLWGFAPVDGRGRMVFLDTFNNGLGAWSIDPTNTTLIGNDPADGRGYAFVPPYGVKFATGSSGSATLTHNLILGRGGNYGIECAIPMRGENPEYNIFLNIRPFNLTNKIAGLIYSPVTNQWILYASPTNIVLTSMSGNGSNPSPYWIQVKVVGDWNTGKYKRAIIGDTQYDISAYTMITGGTSINGLSQARLELYGKTGSVAGYLGYILVTRDEP